MLTEKDIRYAEERLVQVKAEEDFLQFDNFTHADALKIGLALAEAAPKPVSIDITRNGQQLFHYAMEGTSADNDAWLQRKRRVVDRYGRSSLFVRFDCERRGLSFEERSRLDADLYAASGGGFPIRLRGGGCIGCIAVSGLPQEEDHALIVQVLKAYRKT